MGFSGPVTTRIPPAKIKRVSLGREIAKLCAVPQPEPIFPSANTPLSKFPPSQAHLQDMRVYPNSFLLTNVSRTYSKYRASVASPVILTPVFNTRSGSHCPLLANQHTHQDHDSYLSFPRCHLRASLCSAVSSSCCLPVPVGRAQVRSRPLYCLSSVSSSHQSKASGLGTRTCHL